jgi:hypothetical protein
VDFWNKETDFEPVNFVHGSLVSCNNDAKCNKPLYITFCIITFYVDINAKCNNAKCNKTQINMLVNSDNPDFFFNQKQCV